MSDEPVVPEVKELSNKKSLWAEVVQILRDPWDKPGIVANITSAMVLAVAVSLVGFLITSRVEQSKIDLEKTKVRNTVGLSLLEQKQKIMTEFAEVIPRSRMISTEYKGLEFELVSLREHLALLGEDLSTSLVGRESEERSTRSRPESFEVGGAGDLDGEEMLAVHGDRGRGVMIEHDRELVLRSIDEAELRMRALMDTWRDRANYISVSQLAETRMNLESGIRIRRMREWFDMMTTLKIKDAELNFEELQQMRESLPSSTRLSYSYLSKSVGDEMREDVVAERWVESYSENFFKAKSWYVAARKLDTSRVGHWKKLSKALKLMLADAVDILYVEAMVEMQLEMRELEQSLVSPQEEE